MITILINSAGELVVRAHCPVCTDPLAADTLATLKLPATAGNQGVWEADVLEIENLRAFKCPSCKQFRHIEVL